MNYGVKKKNIANKTSINSLLKKLPDEWENYEAVIGEPIVLKRPGISKILKYGKIASIKNFKELFNSKFSIKYHFDMFHGNGILFKAIEQLPDKDKKDFKEFVSNNNFFNQGNMFITKSPTVMEAYFTDVF